jgi:tRNA(Arg) A34 adenosine deaminase TadA
MKVDHNQFMDRAIALAQEAMDEGNRPAGCVIVKDGRVIGEGRNLVYTAFDPSAHGEMVAIRNVAASLKTVELSGCVLYTTMEPCPMCCWTIIDCGISTLVLGGRHASMKRKGLGTYSVESMLALTERSLELVTGVRQKECEEMRRNWKGWDAWQQRQK